MSDFITSIIRTYVPIIVGTILAFLASKGITLDAEAAANLTLFLGALFSGVYYLVVRLIERKFPQAGWLLGQAKVVKYTEPK